MSTISFRHKTIKWSDDIGLVLVAQTLRWRFISEYPSTSPCEAGREEQDWGRSWSSMATVASADTTGSSGSGRLGLVFYLWSVIGWGLHQESGGTLGEVSLFSRWQSWGILNCELSTVADSPSIWEKRDLKGHLHSLHHEWSNSHVISAMHEVLYGRFHSSIQ